MRLEVYDDVAMLFHSDEKDILLVQHMIENLFFVKKVVRAKLDLSLYQLLQSHPYEHLANVIDFSYSHEKTILIEEFVNGCTLEYKLSQRRLPHQYDYSKDQSQHLYSSYVTFPSQDPD